MIKTKPTIEFPEACTRAIAWAERKGLSGVDALEAIELYLARAGFHCTFGVEYVSLCDRELAYLNTGDTYDTTIASELGKLFITSWGDWYEDVEQGHCQENDLIRCGYCGEFTPVAENWQETICESCNNNVAG